MSAQSKLFQSISVGSVVLQHRVVMAPLTRLRSTPEHVPLDIVAEMYEQRSRTPGTLLVAEGTMISPNAGGYPNVPGIWNEEQVSQWKKVTSAVHKNGSYMFCQLAACGRGASPAALKAEGPFDYVAPSAIKISYAEDTPRELSIPEIKEYVQAFVEAAKNAVHAGFDGIEIHGANGFLVDEFIQSVSNERTDIYGGSVENRSRFALEIVDAIASAIGADRVALRLSPWSTAQDMRMPDPVPQFSHLVAALRSAHADLAYLHVIEPRVVGDVDKDPLSYDSARESNDFLREIWKGKPFISAGGYNRESALEASEKTGDLIAFGRHFIANPDLVERLKRNVPLHKYDRSTFYSVRDPKGYIDQPFAQLD
ncbi:FMN-linked oxidoreductase [Punctularia strigosozonata HHB-11173 SS5]|uniref:FMN-linked oxidoreductase n=1 Tax=Punctularia strigosozonata (strain HHB-11173) TaxID=741275 RepID=R7S144_PUNST|nr:FMN-linked oxidoreductase [Punctularia strigosozonata HHB-11173 SS5]EIN03569.1 FMN-linked oxidoreductase [Punctularia strigosozonata HHB-11173 SS5]